MRTFALSASAALALALAACARWLPAPVPMRSIAWPHISSQQAASRARCLVVFLPGLGDDADD
ncbi:MAG TPA: hypothetical protein VF516_42095, partial [Kofleriaceae bacterium]